MITKRTASLFAFFVLLPVALFSAAASAASHSYSQEKQLLPQVSVTNGWFGDALAMDGDTAVVAAPGDDSGWGAVYVFERDGDNWRLSARLTVPQSGSSQPLRAVAVSGDTIVVGRSTDSNIKGNHAGAVYLFEKPDGGWRNMTEATKKLMAGDGATNRTFGTAVSIHGDTLVVGAAGRGNSYPGAAYVFQSSDTGWQQVAKLTASDGADGDLFGFSLDMEGDRIVVGAYGKNDDTGAAYLFTKPESGWGDAEESARLSVQRLSSGDQFGYAVAVSASHIAVGADRDDDNGTDAGAVYLFSGSKWSLQEKVIPDDGFDDQGFGYAVDIAGNTLLVGALLDNHNGFKSGSVYPFRVSCDSVVPLEEIGALDGAAEDRFGGAVAISGNRLLVGAYTKTVNGESSAGSAYMFVGTADDTSGSGSLNCVGSDDNDGSDSNGAGSGGGGAWLLLSLAWLYLPLRWRSRPAGSG